MSDLNSPFRPIATRIDNAEERFVEWASELAGLTTEQAWKALAEYKRHRVVKIDSVLGSFQLKHGAFGEAAPLRRAAGLEA